jgi:DNA-binding CsgD family transcriptional regulator
MPNRINDVHFVMLCDWRGRCVWSSGVNYSVKAGEFIWDNLAPASQSDMKTLLGRVVSLREPHVLEVMDQHGEGFRGRMWPLDSPEMAVCILAERIPQALVSLTDRERECLELLAQGIETRLIAGRLDVSISTVQTHLKRSREKLGLTSSEALASFAARYCYPVGAPLMVRA